MPEPQSYPDETLLRTMIGKTVVIMKRTIRPGKDIYVSTRIKVMAISKDKQDNRWYFSVKNLATKVLSLYQADTFFLNFGRAK